MERWDKPDEVYRDLVVLDKLRREQALLPGQAGHFMRLLDRMAELTNTSCVDVLKALNEDHVAQFAGAR